MGFCKNQTQTRILFFWTPVEVKANIFLKSKFSRYMIDFEQSIPYHFQADLCICHNLQDFSGVRFFNLTSAMAISSRCFTENSQYWIIVAEIFVTFIQWSFGSVKFDGITIVWKFILSNATYDWELFSKLTLPKSIEKFLEDYLQSINSLINFVMENVILLKCGNFNSSQVFFKNFNHCKSILTMKNVSKNSWFSVAR